VSFLPGVMTPTDVQSALNQGVRLMKMFPAHLLGPEWIEAMADPFPEAAFVATGGISAANAREFIDRGARAVAAASAFTDNEARAKLLQQVLQR
jgi:2-dehydro-3-deoxyphosphogluconate aldolase/(4S)-4-hydroxy-2-oxoglutarate aldolase